MRRVLAILSFLTLSFALLPAIAAAEAPCDDSFTPIYEIQGAEDESPLHGDPVTTIGVVTVDLQRSDQQRGFFVQDAAGDGDKATSDGVFVFHQDSWGWDVSVGDVVRVTGTVDEQFGRTQIENVSDITTCGTSSVDATRIKVRKFTQSPERYESMYVMFQGTLLVSDTYNLHRFGDIWGSDGAVTETPTNRFPAGTPQLFNYGDRNMSNVVMFGDGSRFSNPSPIPFFHSGDTLRNGDSTHNPVGAVFYDFGNFKLVNDPSPEFNPTNPRSDAPDVGGDVVVASFNVLNYWTTPGGRGASSAEQLSAQTGKLVAAISEMGADIVGLQEVENGSPGDIPIVTLVDALNAHEGSTVWARIDGFDQNVYPIVNEIIYRIDRVSPFRGALTLVDSAFDDFRFPGNDPNDQLGRRPVAQAFEYDGSVFTVVVNHFKSKSTSGASGPDKNLGDGQSGHNARRVMQAQAVLDWIPHVQAATGDDDVLVIGDLNAYAFEDPVLLLESELDNILKRADRRAYSYVYMNFNDAPFIGIGTLDHALATKDLRKQVAGVAVWHINSDEPRALDWFNPSLVAPGPFRSSDHDPILIGLDLKN
jgi:predicted extracellular nuclease